MRLFCLVSWIAGGLWRSSTRRTPEAYGDRLPGFFSGRIPAASIMHSYCHEPSQSLPPPFKSWPSQLSHSHGQSASLSQRIVTTSCSSSFLIVTLLRLIPAFRLSPCSDSDAAVENLRCVPKRTATTTCKPSLYNHIVPACGMQKGRDAIMENLHCLQST